MRGLPLAPKPIFPDQAAHALAIFKELRVADLPGKPTFGECSAQWVFDFVACVFGGYDAETGHQRIREYGLLIAKKNTKSTLAAGIMLTALILCWREEEEHLILAPTKEVADNSYKPAAAMVRADPELSALFHIQDHTRTITHRVTRNTLKVVAADTDTVSGKKAGRILVDELWLFGDKPNAEAMFMEALGGQVSRNEGWVIYLTTQSDKPPAGVFKDRLSYWRDVRDGVIEDEKTLGLLYEFPKAMIERKEYLLPEHFGIVNPNLGRSVSAQWLLDQIRRTQEKTDGRFQQFLAKHLNVEIGLNLRNDRWAGVDFWQACEIDGGLTLDEMLKRCEVVSVGIDGGGLDDLLGLALVGRCADSGAWLHWAHAWAHPTALERNKSEASRFGDFVQAGEMTLVHTIGEDVAGVVEIVARVWNAGLMDRVGIDQHGIGAIIDGLAEAGIEGNESIIGISQGWRLHGAIKTLERKLAERQFRHGGSSLMAWCVSNARIVPVGNAVTITKQASGAAKIDPLMATLNAVTLLALNPSGKRRSFWERADEAMA